jgi:hypothetical protein
MKTSIWTETMTQNIHAPNRRRFVRSAVASSLLMPGILSEILAADSAEQFNPLSPKQPHFPARAKSVIFLFMSGGVSHIDSFDPKPKLIEDHGNRRSQAMPCNVVRGAGEGIPLEQLKRDQPQSHIAATIFE